MQIRRQAEELQSKGASEEAELRFNEALLLLETSYGPSSTVLRRVLGPFAAFYRDEGRFSEAIGLHKRIVALLEENNEAETEQMADALEQYALTIRAQARVRNHDRLVPKRK